MAMEGVNDLASSINALPRFTVRRSNRPKRLAGQTGLTRGSDREEQFLGYVCAFDLFASLILARLAKPKQASAKH